MNWPDGFSICVGAAAVLSTGACLVLQQISRRRLLALREELAKFSEDLLQMAELQMDTYRHLCRNISDIEEKVLDLSVPSSDTPLPLERRHQVLTLARKGVSVEEIARRLNMPKGEAELILSLRKYVAAKAPPQRTPGALKGYAQASS